MILYGALKRGLLFNDLKQLTLAQLLDYCQVYNENELSASEEDEEIWASQEDINAL